ncbi:MAG: hypothetical protein HDR74_02770 [Bacteroides sp.]|nr:hypothetical protein [Bacteroides sp.]MDE5810395.1 hypothetical protein [Muribaculaceae bacterium]MDE6225730.1 hypothetical protein [Muribaculaceae bacterium]
MAFKSTYKLFITILLTVIGIFAFESQAQDAASILKATSQRLKSAPSISATLSILADGRTNTGHLTLSGNRFALTTPIGSTWYDGKTLWSHSISTREVNISEPDQSELAEINPLVMIDQSLSAYKTQLITSKPDKVIEMTPVKQRGADIQKAVITISSATGYPSQIILTVNNRIIKVVFTKVVAGKKLADKDFMFDSKQFPNATINDLR